MELINSLISVCIPVFNGEKYIRESVESVLAQTEKRFELLVVDNCSTDHTLEIAGSYNDLRIKRFKNEHNLGLFGNFNKCVELATGKYIVILPHDDLLLPTMLETFSHALESDRQIGLAYSSYLQINSKGEKINFMLTDTESRVMSPEQAFRKFLRACPIQCAMVRRDIFREVGAFDPDLPLAGDLNMWCRIALAGYRVYYHKAPQNCMRVHPSSMTRYIYSNGDYGSQVFKCFQNVFERIPSQSDLYNLRSLAAEWPLRTQLIYIARSLANGNWRAIKRHFGLFYEIVKWAGGIRVIPSLLIVVLNLAMGLPRELVRKKINYEIFD